MNQPSRRARPTLITLPASFIAVMTAEMVGDMTGVIIIILLVFSLGLGARMGGVHLLFWNSAGAQREVRDLVVARTRRESGATRVMPARGVGVDESGRPRCEEGPQEWEAESDAMLSTEPEAR